MSAYVSGETEFTDQDCLVQALKEMGYEVESHKVAQRLEGYEGDERSQVGHVIIRRQYVGGSSNDVGFERMPDGKFRSHISEFDQRRHFSGEVQAQVRRNYARVKTTAFFKAKGYTVTQTEPKVKGRIRLKATRWA